MEWKIINESDVTCLKNEVLCGFDGRMRHQQRIFDVTYFLLWVTGVWFTMMRNPSLTWNQASQRQEACGRMTAMAFAWCANHHQKMDPYSINCSHEWILVWRDSALCKNLTMARFHPWFSPRIRVASRVRDQELMCALKEKTQDPMRNRKWNGSESSHDVFYHNVVQSCGHVVTRVSHCDETCAPCKQSCQWRCQTTNLGWSWSSNVRDVMQ